MHRIGRPLRRSVWAEIFLDSSKPAARFLHKLLPCTSHPDPLPPNPYSSTPRPSSVFATHCHPNPVTPHVFRRLCTGHPVEYDKEVNEINLKFAEAREEIEAALEAKETVYFDEEAECAREAVKSVLDMFNGLLGKLPEKDRSALQRAMGLKMEQLKAELKQLDD